MLRFALLGRRTLPLLRLSPPHSAPLRQLSLAVPLRQERGEAKIGDKADKAKAAGSGIGGMSAKETDDWLAELE